MRRRLRKYLIAYKDRALVAAAGKDVFAHPLIIDGRLAGTWRRALNRRSTRSRAVDLAPYRRGPPAETRAVAAAAARFERFITTDLGP